MEPGLLSYAVAIAVSGFLAGGLIGFVIRGARARRQKEMLTSEVNQLREKLENNAKQVHLPVAPAPRRWTGTEVAAVLGAIGALLGAGGALLGNYRGAEIEELRVKLEEAENSKSKESERYDFLNSSLKELMTYDLEEWMELPKEEYALERRRTPLPVELYNRHVSSPCSTLSEIVLSYKGNRPAILNCKGSKVTVQLGQPTRILLIPARSVVPASGAQAGNMAARLP